MKKLSIYFILVFAFIYLAGVSVFAQQKMTPEEADAKIQSLTSDVNKLKATNSSLDAEIRDLKDNLVEKNIEVTRCEDQLYALVSATRDQVEAFRQKLADTEKKIDELSRLSTIDLVSRKSEIDALEATAKELSSSRISLLPEFYDRVQALPGKIQNLRDALKKAENTYTVGTWSKDRDCLWNISKKPDIYDNPFMWPKIWQSNRDKIKDPDIIRTGWELKIPAATPLTDEETRAARSYWAKKKEAQSGTQQQERIREQNVER
jgi:nucleoid-associated protein YgaU